MNPPIFTKSRSNEDPENIVEELKKVLEVIHVVSTERFELVSYRLKSGIWLTNGRRPKLRMHTSMG